MGENRVTFEWQATGPSSSERVIAFVCRRDRDQTERPCTWNAYCILYSCNCCLDYSLIFIPNP